MLAADDLARWANEHGNLSGDAAAPNGSFDAAAAITIREEGLSG